jgi:hypothetical protein
MSQMTDKQMFAFAFLAECKEAGLQSLVEIADAIERTQTQKQAFMPLLGQIAVPVAAAALAAPPLIGGLAGHIAGAAVNASEDESDSATRARSVLAAYEEQQRRLEALRKVRRFRYSPR